MGIMKRQNTKSVWNYTKRQKHLRQLKSTEELWQLPQFVWNKPTMPKAVYLAQSSGSQTWGRDPNWGLQMILWGPQMIRSIIFILTQQLIIQHPVGYTVSVYTLQGVCTFIKLPNRPILSKKEANIVKIQNR